MDYAPELIPQCLARFADVPHRNRIAQERLFELAGSFSLKSVTGPGFIERLIDARIELKAPANSRNVLAMQLALVRFERELAAFEIELDRLDAKLRPNRSR